MKITFQLTYQDFLAYQMYANIKSELSRKSRFKSQVIPAAVYVCIGLLYLYTKESLVALIIWTLAGVLWYLLYPIYGRWKYKNYLVKYIHEHYKNRVHKEVTLELINGSIRTNEMHANAQIDIKQFKEVIETRDHFFLKLVTDVSIIIPKTAITDHTRFIAFFTQLHVAYLNEQSLKLN